MLPDGANSQKGIELPGNYRVQGSTRRNSRPGFEDLGDVVASPLVCGGKLRDERAPALQGIFRKLEKKQRGAQAD